MATYTDILLAGGNFSPVFGSTVNWANARTAQPNPAPTNLLEAALAKSQLPAQSNTTDALTQKQLAQQWGDMARNAEYASLFRMIGNAQQGQANEAVRMAIMNNNPLINGTARV